MDMGTVPLSHPLVEYRNRPMPHKQKGENKMNLSEDSILHSQVRELAKEEPFYVPLMANVSAVICEMMPKLNWAGFYLMRNGRLVLGPFQGKAACIHIETGKGVCGTAVKNDCTIRVENVHEFPGHIACDSASNSEIVIPIHSGGKTVGVLDIDSPYLNRFSAEDQEMLEGVVRILEENMIFI